MPTTGPGEGSSVATGTPLDRLVADPEGRYEVPLPFPSPRSPLAEAEIVRALAFFRDDEAPGADGEGGATYGLPRDAGGLGDDPELVLRGLQATARRRVGAAMTTLSQRILPVGVLAVLGTAPQRRRWLANLNAGNGIATAVFAPTVPDPAQPPRATRSEDGEGWRIRGKLRAVAGARDAASFLVPAFVESAAGPESERLFVVEGIDVALTVADSRSSPLDDAGVMDVSLARTDVELVAHLGPMDDEAAARTAAARARAHQLAAFGQAAIALGLAERSLRIAFDVQDDAGLGVAFRASLASAVSAVGALDAGLLMAARTPFGWPTFAPAVLAAGVALECATLAVDVTRAVLGRPTREAEDAYRDALVVRALPHGRAEVRDALGAGLVDAVAEARTRGRPSAPAGIIERLVGPRTELGWPALRRDVPALPDLTEIAQAARTVLERARAPAAREPTASGRRRRVHLGEAAALLQALGSLASRVASDLPAQPAEDLAYELAALRVFTRRVVARCRGLGLADGADDEDEAIADEGRLIRRVG